MNLQGDGDAFMRHLAKQIEDMGGATPPPAPAGLKLPGGVELPPHVQAMAKVIGASLVLVGLPLARGLAFQKVWNQIRGITVVNFGLDPEELSFREALALSSAVHMLVKAFGPVVNVNLRDRTLKGK